MNERRYGFGYEAENECNLIDSLRIFKVISQQSFDCELSASFKSPLSKPLFMTSSPTQATELSPFL